MLSRLAFLRLTSIDICKVAIKNIRNVHAVSANQIADILQLKAAGCLSMYDLLVDTRR